MIEVTCPKCGGVGQAPREKVNTRLVCRKCHAAFHIATSGRAILGDPPVQKDNGRRKHDPLEAAKPKVDWQEKLPEFTVTGRSALISLGVLLVAGVVYFVMSRPAETLTDRAKVVAKDFADGDLGRLKGDSIPGTEDDLVQWYGKVRDQLDQAKKEWAGREILVGVLVIDENKRGKNGEVTAILSPTRPSERDATIRSTAEVGGVSMKPFEVMLYFTPDSWGKWRLDGKKMREKGMQAL